MRTTFTIALLATLASASTLNAQTILFDFSNAPPSTSLPADLTVGGVTAHLTGTGQSFSFQQTGTVGIAPVGFSGLCVWPNSVFLADLNVSFSKTLTFFSILYAAQELDCDCSSTMKVTAYMNGTLVGSSTMSAVPGGVWPSATLSFTAASGFNSVVVHYNNAPACGCDYGVIFMADNMKVTPKPGPAADLNGDTKVDAADLAILLGAWGTSNPAADLNHDGIVNGADLGSLLGAWTG
ncbi:MAG: GC-type dockerin domain-anchored protein [Phycisphaerales bacterium]